MYITGSITDANPGPALYALMAPALTAAGYTLVDTVTISTRTHKVWKSAAANNAASLDWYLDIGYTTTGAGNLWLVPFEYYDPATDLGYRGPYSNTSSTTLETTYFTRYGATGSALETNWLGAGSNTTHSLTLASSAFGYWISVTGNRVAVMLSNDASAVLYAGMYSPDSLYAAKAGSALFPLVMAKLSGTGATTSSSTTATAAPTRVAPWTSMHVNGWGITIQVRPSSVDALAASPAIPSTSAAYPLVIWPGMVYSYNTPGMPHPGTFGSLYDVAVCNASGTVARGDSLTTSGGTWTLTTPSGIYSWLIKQV